MRVKVTMEPSVNPCSEMANKTCFEFNKTTFWAVVGCRTGFSVVGALMSAVAILYFIRLRVWNKVELKPAGRLALYLCTASLFNGISVAVATIVPVSNGPICDHVVATHFCTAASFLIGYSVWVILVLMVWIYVQIVMAVLTDSKNYYEHSRCCTMYTNCRDSICYDGCILTTTFFIPLIFSVIPLASTNPELYGLAGAWCWIRARDEDCQKIIAGVIEQFVLWYAWVMAFALVLIITMIIVGVVLYKAKQYAPDSHQNLYRRYLRDIRPLTIYPIIFTVIYGFGCANRIVYAFHKETILWLWIPHGIADAFVSLLIPVFFLLHHRKKLNDQQSEERWPLLDYRNETDSYA